MKPTLPTSAPRNGWGRAVLWVGVAVMLAAVVAGGCSSEKRYRVLSFFFDGVPDPNGWHAQIGLFLRYEAAVPAWWV